MPARLGPAPRSPFAIAAWLPAAAVLLGAGWGANQFTPLLLIYRHALGLGTGTLEAMFGFYALGLIPGLLLAGPLSDARGRRTVVVPAAVLSLLASVVIAAGADDVALLFAGRLLTGVATGAVFAAATAWLRELSRAAATGAGAPARRAAVAMTAGFALGPLVAGVLAQWAPAPRVVPLAPHVVLMLGVLVLLRGAPETVTTEPAGSRACRCRGSTARASAAWSRRWRRGSSRRPGRLRAPADRRPRRRAHERHRPHRRGHGALRARRCAGPAPRPAPRRRRRGAAARRAPASSSWAPASCSPR